MGQPRPHKDSAALAPGARTTAANPAGPGWDLSKIAILPPDPRGNAEQAVREPSGLGRWTSSVLHAPETKPADSVERAADHAADAAVRDQRPSPPSVPLRPPDAGTPPWGAGRPLSRAEREYHEPPAGADLDDVRIHEGAAPARWATMLGARAFTIGRDIVLGPGQYAPDTGAGRHLMAHELSHVVMGRGRAPVLARVALTAADFDAIADSLHDAITTAAADQELIFVGLQKLERDPAAIKSLTTAYKTRHKTDLLTDLGSRLKGHGLGFAQTLLGVKGGLTVAPKPPGAPAEYEAIARAVNAALVAKTPDAESVYAALLPLDRDSSRTATLNATYAKLFTNQLDADLTSKLKGADQSYALYLLNAPKAALPHAPTTFKAQPGPGTPPTFTPPPAAGGTVKPETKVPYETTAGDKGTYGFGVGYSGALSGDSRWLQFIEREIDYDPKGGGKRTALDKEVESGGSKGNKYKLTTVTASPNWIVDSYSSSNPFFDETHGNDAWRDATSVSIYDAPSAHAGEVKKLFDAGHTNVTSRAHFEIFLIRDFSTIYHVEIEILWTFSSPTKYTTNRLVKAAATVTALPATFKTVLVAKYPAFAYIR